MPSKRRRHNPSQALTMEDYQKILKSAVDYGILCLEISGEGEPLLSENLMPILEEADKNGLMTTLITNGNTMDESKAAFCRDHNVTLVFSLHTLDKAKYEMDNKLPGSFDRKIANIETAAEIYKGTKTQELLTDVYRIAVHSTLHAVTTLNEIDNFRLRSFCKDRDMFFSVASLALVGSALEHPEIIPDSPVSLKYAVAHGNNSIIHSHSSKDRFGPYEVCGTALYGLNIGWDGAILFDAHYGYDVGERNLLGNIKEISFEEAAERQKVFTDLLFKSIRGPCPVRRSAGREFLRKVLDGEIELKF